MTFKNVNTATNQILGQVRGTQNNYIRAHHGASAVNYASEKSVFDKPLEFKEWFMKVVEFNKSKGFDMILIEKHGVRGIRRMKDGKAQDRTLADFYDEWKNEYVDKYYL